MSKITILFGEMGSGKNYWGEIFAKTENAVFFDGDTVVTPEMLEKVSQFKPLSLDIIEQYVKILESEILHRAANYDNLIVAQALYLNKNRLDLVRALTRAGHKVKLYWVKVSFWQNLKQLWNRPKGFRWVIYWLMNKPFFEHPTHHYELIR